MLPRGVQGRPMSKKDGRAPCPAGPRETQERTRSSCRRGDQDFQDRRLLSLRGPRVSRCFRGGRSSFAYRLLHRRPRQSHCAPAHVVILSLLASIQQLLFLQPSCRNVRWSLSALILTVTRRSSSHPGCPRHPDEHSTAITDTGPAHCKNINWHQYRRREHHE